jgi:predicted NAD-dependent protein-ADP-ribosyltransferase YbiA (DUF1768 family)
MATFAFKFNSADAAPGAGVHERHASCGRTYDDLRLVPRWRSVLSQFYPSDFVFDDWTFVTAEHAWHFAKLVCCCQPEKASLFTKESGSSMALSNGAAAKKAGGKCGLHRMSLDECVEWEALRPQWVEAILFAKFSVPGVARDTLLRTCDATLVHIVTNRGKASDVIAQPELERVRARLSGSVTGASGDVV